LFVPIAFVSPRLGLAWALGLTFWLAPSEGGTPRDLIVAWTTTAAAVGLAAARSPGVREARGGKDPQDATRFGADPETPLEEVGGSIAADRHPN
jgi:hypothetical protein